MNVLSRELVELHQKKFNELFSMKNNLIFQEALNKTPNIQAKEIHFSKDEITIGTENEITLEEKSKILNVAKTLGPWKKGPFRIFGELIDGEWRCDLKWNRIAPYVDSMKDKTILDIGCNNGYFMFKMAQHAPKYTLGIDPSPRVYSQFQFLQNFIKSPTIEMSLLGVENLSHFRESFDIIFSMGIIYHHKNPIEQLIQIKNIMKKNGQLILETLGVDSNESFALFPEDRYAKMRNIWFIPTLQCLINWAKKAKFKDIQVISSTPLTDDEQRVTPWSGPVSLKDFLHPKDKTKTIEGHRAPYRLSISCRKA